MVAGEGYVIGIDFGLKHLGVAVWPDGNRDCQRIEHFKKPATASPTGQRLTNSWFNIVPWPSS